MPSQAKIQAVAELQEKLARAKSVVFAKYSGLDVSQQTKLRRAVKEAGGEIVITRNRLLNIALGKPEGLAGVLQDQLLTLFSYEDEVSALKAMTKFMADNDLPEIKGGWLEAKLLSVAEVETLSKVPGRSELITMLLQRLQGPAYGLRNVLEAVPGSLVRVLTAVANKQ